jgi:antitoxin MazE
MIPSTPDFIQPPNHPRDGWDESFARMASNHDDELLDQTESSIWDEAEWEW